MKPINPSPSQPHRGLFCLHLQLTLLKGKIILLGSRWPGHQEDILSTERRPGSQLSVRGWLVWPVRTMACVLRRNVGRRGKRQAGATVAGRLACVPPTKANRVQLPARPQADFRMRESRRTIPLVGGLSRGSPISPALSFRCCPILTSVIIIGSQGLAVKSRPILTRMKGWGEREIPEKTRRPAASSGTIPTYEDPGVTRPGIENGSPWWEVAG
ncbi:hypothetical protein PR048_007726 [Dryococelus australis]|uniref:Uncharacterized protein n=1 Tax=Dryococelus australis TaxID=614101 RepID=A0ABQ9HV27_9NEOP|nr:hypothetical protein PR048_007726 [Dryococelus australis]